MRRGIPIVFLVLGVALGSPSPARAAMLTLVDSTLSFSIGPLPIAAER